MVSCWRCRIDIIVRKDWHLNGGEVLVGKSGIMLRYVCVRVERWGTFYGESEMTNFSVGRFFELFG